MATNIKQTENLADVIKKIKPGQTVKVYHKIKEINSKGELKERLQMFEGQVLMRKHGNEKGATITVRKVSEGVGVEKIFPLHSPIISKIEIVKAIKARRAKLYFLRKPHKKLKEQKTK